MDGKTHHIVRGEYRERSQGKALTKRTFAAVRHRQQHRRINPGEGTLAFGHRSDLPKATGGERERNAFSVV